MRYTTLIVRLLHHERTLRCLSPNPRCGIDPFFWIGSTWSNRLNGSLPARQNRAITLQNSKGRFVDRRSRDGYYTSVLRRQRLQNLFFSTDWYSHNGIRISSSAPIGWTYYRHTLAGFHERLLPRDQRRQLHAKLVCWHPF